MELDKLVCFLGDRKQIEIGDLEKMVPMLSTETSWQMVEELIWDTPPQGVIKKTNIDAPFFYGWVAFMRTQLQLGYRIAALTQRGTSPDEIRKRFPNVWPKMLERKKTIAQKKEKIFLRRA